MSVQQFEGASAIVSGGAGGLGEATVRWLHADGLGVVIADLAADKGKALADELGSRAIFASTDVTSEDSILGAIEQAKQLGTLRYAVVAHGGKVVWCRDATEVSDFVLNLAKERQAKLIVKSKSMTTEEIDLNERLEHHGRIRGQLLPHGHRLVARVQHDDRDHRPVRWAWPGPSPRARPGRRRRGSCSCRAGAGAGA